MVIASVLLHKQDDETYCFGLLVERGNLLSMYEHIYIYIYLKKLVCLFVG